MTFEELLRAIEEAGRDEDDCVIENSVTCDCYDTEGCERRALGLCDEGATSTPDTGMTELTGELDFAAPYDPEVFDE